MVEAQLKDSLERLTAAIRLGDGSAVKRSMGEIEETMKSRRSEIDAQLRHFLRNRSYEKALMYLNDAPDIPKGRCGGRTDFS